jgi:Domain of unknown function (DUF4338)
MAGGERRTRRARMNRFVESVARDLERAGVEVSLMQRREGIPILALPRDGHIELSEQTIRRQQLLDAKGLIERMEERENVFALFARGATLRIDTIQPRVQICHSSQEHALYRYCGLFQSVPSMTRIGRQIRALVFDDGQEDGPVLMGAFGLASAVYSISCRDKHLSWSGRQSRQIKDAGLRRLMDLAICTALPPYSYLRGGKLIAALALSDTVTKEFGDKYNDLLLGLTTSCATGLHCPIFNRIMLRRGGLYRRIGETAGFSMIWATNETFQSPESSWRSCGSKCCGVRGGVVGGGLLPAGPDDP